MNDDNKTCSVCHPYRINTEAEGYEDFLSSVRERFATIADQYDRKPNLRHLFQTRRTLLFDPSSPANDLFALFLANLPPDRRQHYTCSACRHFVRRYGGLVTINPDGEQCPVAWLDDKRCCHPFFREAVSALDQAVRKSIVVGVLMTDKTVWGQPETGPWHHMAVVPNARLLHQRTPLKTPGQMAADKLQDFDTLKRALTEFTPDHLRVAKTLLETDALYRSEKCLGVASWLLELQERLAATKNEMRRDNMIWLAVAWAPPGWCHPRSTMIGTLLDDIKEGKPFHKIEGAFAAKMHPLRYQRPVAAPSEGQINEAERIIAALKSSGSLERRFAKLEDIQKIWVPASEPKQIGESSAEGVFSHLREAARTSALIETGAPAVTMTWVKFAKDILPKAEKIDYLVPGRAESYSALVTAANPESPPILQWDREGRRNTVTQYVYYGGSLPHHWALIPGQYVKVNAVALRSSMWDPDRSYPHMGEGLHLVLNGCSDLGYERSGGLFVENLRSEYHGIRHTLEAHIRQAVIAGKDEATACGLALGKASGPWDVVLRVTAGGIRALYRLDRWE